MKLVILILIGISIAGGAVMVYQIVRLNRIVPSIISRLFLTALFLMFASRVVILFALFYSEALPYFWVINSILFCLIIGCFAWAIKILADGWRELKG